MQGTMEERIYDRQVRYGSLSKWKERKNRTSAVFIKYDPSGMRESNGKYVRYPNR